MFISSTFFGYYLRDIMFFITLISNSLTYTVILTITSLFLMVWYYIFIFKPYAKFPACRLEYKVLYWALTGRNLNVAMLQTLAEKSKLYHEDGMFVAWAGQPIIVAYGEEIVKKIVNEPAATDKPRFYKVTEFTLGKGIFTSNGEDFKRHRKIVTPAFHVSAVKSYTSVMNKCAEGMMKRLLSTESRPTEDIINILNECSFKIIIETNLGHLNIGDVDEALLMKTVKQLTQLIIKRVWSPWLYFDFLLFMFPSAREVSRNEVYIKKKILLPSLKKIKASLSSFQSTPHTPVEDFELCGKKVKSFGEIFVEQHLQDPTLSLKDIANQTTILIGAGFDTIVHSLKFALFLMGLHQDIQDRARDEVMLETEGHINYEDLFKLTYLESVIKESLRLYPVPLYGRLIQKDLQCGKYNIPKNSSVLLFPYMLHRNPEIYPDPEKFDPERFMNKNSNIKPWHFIPFAEGLRQCPGKNYAMIQMKIILAHVLKNFKIISLDRREDIEVKWAIILDCTKKLRMQFIPTKTM